MEDSFFLYIQPLVKYLSGIIIKNKIFGIHYNCLIKNNKEMYNFVINIVYRNVIQ